MIKSESIIPLLTVCANSENTGYARVGELSIEIINRKKAEIERLNVELKAMRGAVYSYKLESERLLQKLQQAQSEAIKEFAELLKRKIWHSGWCNLERTITPEIITNLAKEMTEVQK